MIARAGLLVVGAALTVSAYGCWAAAIQFAPMALQTSVGLASATAGAAQSSEGPTPGVIELREDPNGSAEYREMRITFTANDARWTPVSDDSSAADGWRPAVNFLQMSFSPPLPPKLSEDHITYLAYAPLYEHTSDDDTVRLKEFNRSFGEPVGTFEWKGRTYQYSLPQVLPPLEFD